MLPPGVAPNNSSSSLGVGGSRDDPLLSVLKGCGLQQYFPLFLGEAMDDMGLLRSMASSKADLAAA